jgi:Ran GTPase-activating protein (RanGAP) involved in mRNA processing and transport
MLYLFLVLILQVANFADMFTGKKSDEIPHAVEALMQALRPMSGLHTLDWSDNAFGPNGVRGFIDFLVRMGMKRRG